MATTYTLIDSEVLSSSAASVALNSIPSTFTDLVVRISGRSSNSGSINENITMTYNNSSGSYSVTWLRGEVAGFPASGRQTNVSINSFAGNVSGSTATANTFGSTEIYIPSYTVSQNRPSSHFSVSESNDVNAPTIYAAAGLRSNTTAVSSIEFTLGGGASYAIGSSFYLYGISNA
jgi:hypothetical protein